MKPRAKAHAKPSIFRTLLYAAGVVGISWALTGLWSGQPGLAYRFTAGDRLIYKLEFRTNGSVDFNPLLGPSQPGAERGQSRSGLVQSFASSLRAELIATIVEENQQGVIVSYSMRNPVVELEVGGRRASEQEADLRRHSVLNVFAAIDLSGRLRSLRFDPVVHEPSWNFVRGVLAMTQVVLSDAKPGSSTAWEAEEEEPEGRYVARYEAGTFTAAGSGANCQVVRKSKLRYLPEKQVFASKHASAGRVASPDVRIDLKPDTNLVACFDPKAGRLLSLSGTDRLVMAAAGRTVGHSEAFISLELLSSGSIEKTDLQALRDANSISASTVRAMPLWEVSTEEEIKAIARRSTLGADTLESLLAALARQETAGQQTEEQETFLYLKFRALGYLQPESCQALGKVLANSNLNSLTFRVLSEALEELGSREAQAALVAAIRSRPNDLKALMRLIPSLGLADNPINSAEELLRDLAFTSSDQNIASTAHLALGSMAYRLADSSPERANRIVDLIIAKAGGLSEEGDIEQLLLTLGNTGSARALPIIVRFATHSSPDVRAVAISALRFIEIEQADTLLLNALSTDSNAAVRQAAAGALSFREMTTPTFEAQKKTLLKDEDEGVRLTVLNNLWKSRETFQESLVLIKRAASEDASKEVRKAASGMLEKSPGGFDTQADSRGGSRG